MSKSGHPDMFVTAISVKRINPMLPSIRCDDSMQKKKGFSVTTPKLQKSSITVHKHEAFRLNWWQTQRKHYYASLGLIHTSLMRHLCLLLGTCKFERDFLFTWILIYIDKII